MRTTRAAFTLVEMMVAMALTVFVMVILSECFVQGLETFSGLKAVGDLQEELRAATTVLRADLSADHFEGKRRLSDPAVTFTDTGNTGKIREGFFVVGQGYTATPPLPNIIYPTTTNPPLPVGYIAGNPPKLSPLYEGADLQGPATQPLNSLYSFRATDHWLHFSVKLRGNAREKVFTAQAGNIGATNYVQQSNATQGADAIFLPGNQTVNSPWAEIAYFLLPSGTTANPTLPGGLGTPLFALYRCQFLVLPETTDANRLGPNGTGLPIVTDPNNTYNNCAPYGNFSGAPIISKGLTVMQFYSPNDLANSAGTRAFNPATYFTATNVAFNANTPPRGLVQGGASAILTNVISFQVQVFKSPHSTITRGNGAQQVTYANPYFPDFEDLNLTNNVPFDTATYGTNTFGTPPTPFSIQALRIVLRIWDPKSHLTRQVTLIQDM